MPAETAPSHDALIAGSGLPRLEARVLLESASGCSRSWLIAHGDETAAPQTVERFQTLAQRRLEHGEPIAYLTGEREFHGLSLSVGPAVLIPRPETELLVDRAIEHLRVWGSDHTTPDLALARRTDGLASGAPAVIDLGTGSGAIALAIAAAVRQARIVATDQSREALAQARSNEARLGLAGRIDWREGSWWEAVRAGERFDLVLANPPYIPAGDPHLSRGDLRHEPMMALSPGPDGLEALRRISSGAPEHLRPGGWLILEHGHDQGAAVRNLLAQAGLTAVQTLADLASRERVTEGRRPQSP
jgi:release factor glutamine methyltransferase